MFDCEICGVKINGEAIREAHIKGAKHQKKMRAAEIMPIADQNPAVVKTEANNIFSCKVCDIVLNSQIQLKAHLDGGKHQAKAGQVASEKKTTESGLQMTSISVSAEHPAAHAPPGPFKGPGPDTGLKAELYCVHCNVYANSDLQYEQHMSSQKHLSKLKAGSVGPRAGKAKPYGRSPLTNNGGSGPGNNFRGRGTRGNRFNHPSKINAGYPNLQNYMGGYAKNPNNFNGGYVRSPNNFNGGYPKSPNNFNGGYANRRGSAQMYPAGYNPSNYSHGKGNHFPSMGTFFPKNGSV